ncbi:hypothetical protein DUNSADRAFT_15573 [Dunaliella salina]|uniref:Phosphoglycerate mutase n=1 Tax=Dunaliella salina TaxID=3046 RepID=A0ABQ7G546_DUNSA|nr:hypothetical protein DUNSADRAFT_15573 [Dunaliella salina]|eukprot:KAF5829726.1 hypothetical protein DUNSADRAFT_15573 [Dunaliella salina]
MQGRPMPPYPETPEQAVARYTSELDWIMGGGNGTLQGNVLVVTHGEAVRTAVTMQQPDAVVYEVNHCAYALLRKGHASASAGAPQPPSQQQFKDPLRQREDAMLLLQGQQGPGLSAPLAASRQQQQQVATEEGSVVVPVNDVPGKAKGADASPAGSSMGAPRWSLACSSGETGVSWFSS